MNKTPLVSIITPNYNGQKFIKEAINSVLSQTYENWEMLIVDDGSTDSSTPIVKSYTKTDKRIKLLKTDLLNFPKLNRGPAAARNTAIKKASGHYIAFLDSDDLWHPEKLEKQIDFMKKNEIAFSYTWYEIINENGEKVGIHTPEENFLSYKNLLKDCKIGCLTSMIDIKKLGKQFIDLNEFDRHADYSLWLKITKKGYKAYCLKQNLASYRLVHASISSNKLKAAIHQWNILRKTEKLNFFIALYNFFFYFTAGISKKIRYFFIRTLKKQ